MIDANKKAEKEWLEKLKRAQNGESVEFTQKELDFLIWRNENLRGKKVDLNQYRKWVNLANAAKALSKNKNFKANYSPPARNKKHATLGLIVKSYEYIEGKELELLRTMFNNTDRFTTNPSETEDEVPDGNVVFGFRVLNIWSE